MPAGPVSVNLFSTQINAKSPWNRLVSWIGTYGRYILITTELVVLMAFLSRFSLDRKLTDLKEEITQKQEVLEINAPLEKEIRTIQEKNTTIKKLLAEQRIPLDALQALHTLLPAGVYLDTLAIDKDSVTTNITVSSTQGLSLFLGNLNITNKFTNIEIGNVVKQQQGIKLTMTASYIKPKTTAKK